ncbi:MAG: hypothetical protein GY845_15200, partial [Planctomycetes bacterium]|nr:hypothetical protein [Planctomycetota bacterium]
NGNNGFDPMESWATYTTQPAQNRPRWGDEDGDYTVLMDMNGDGLPDHVHHRNYNMPAGQQYGLWVALNKGNGFEPLGDDPLVDKPWISYTRIEQNRPRRGGEYGDYTALIDMNGDGLPDHVHHRNYNMALEEDQYGVWVAINTGSGFNALGNDPLVDKPWADYSFEYCAGEWCWQEERLNMPRSGGKFDDDNYYRDFKVLRDMNGDGLPDHVATHPIVPYFMFVAINNGNGFEDTEEWCNYDHNPWNYSRESDIKGRNGGDTIILRDMNGDGLIDHVFPGPIVALNNGTGFEPAEPWDSYTGNDSTFLGWPRWADTGGTDFGDKTALRDVNGDGLPDRVHHKNYDTVDYGTYIALNRGDGFGAQPPAHDLEQWVDNDAEIRQDRPRWSVKDGDFTVLRDMNGDGMLDQVHHKNYATGQPGVWVRLNSGKPDLIKSVSNGYGGTTTIEYTSSSKYDNHRLPHIVYTVSSIKVEDDFGTNSTTTYDYSGGFFDYTHRDFRGFEYVTRTNPDGTTVRTRFHQEDDGDYLQDDFGYLKGRQREVVVREADSNLISKTIFTWVYDELMSGDTTCAFVKLTKKESMYYEDDPVTPTVESKETYDYNSGHGGLVETMAEDIIPGTTEIITTTSEYQNYGAWLWRQTKATVKGEVSESGTVRETIYGYYNDGTGNIWWEEYWLASGPNPRVYFDDYDAYGNCTKTTDAMGYSTEYEYDSATHTYPVLVEYPTTSGVEHIYEVGLDYKYGKARWQKDENNNVTYYGFDDFGRVTQVDYPDGGQVITVYGDYDPSSSSPSYVFTQVLENDSGSKIPGVEYFDGFGRTLQTVALGEAGKTIIMRMYYDKMGRNNLTKGPFFSTDVLYPIVPPAICPQTQTEFDTRGRPDKTISYDSSGKYRTYREIEATISYSALSTTVTDPDDNIKTETKDSLGRIIEVEEHNGAKTEYNYNAAGDMTSLVDAHGNVTTIWYDTLGRKTSMTDPDMGTWIYEYDSNGNLTDQIDANGHKIKFTYDELGRVTKKEYPWTSDPTVTYQYDGDTCPNGKGRLFKVIKSNPKVEIKYGEYDEMGRVISSSKWIDGDIER